MSSIPKGSSMLHHLYIPIEDVEKLERYRVGGYHPVAIGDQFHHRYRIVHKLGYGSYSTIWLARDERSHKYVAIKVCTADSNPHECDVLSSLTSPQFSGNSPWRSMIPLILDSFQIQGPNGTHACYVTSPARMSLSDAKDGSYVRLFKLEVARVLAAQLAIAVEYIHTQGLAHGDLHFGIVLMQLPSGFNEMSDEELYKIYSEPESEAVTRFDGEELSACIPPRAILPVWLGESSEDLTPSNAKILLSDFGEAFPPAKQDKFDCCTPLVNRAPETRFESTKPLSFPSDIWSLACLMWDVIAQSPLFEGFLATEDDMTCEHVDALGILPPEWWYQWDARQKKFSEDGKPINRESYRSLQDRFEDSVQEPRQAEKMPLFEPAERDTLLSMIRSMLSFRPESRPSAKEVLASEWMVKWALPEYEKAHKS